MNAAEMFEKLGFKLYSKTESSLIYKFEVPGYKHYICFELDMKTVSMTQVIWIDSEEGKLVPMDEREPNLKECSKYGHWQSETYIEIGKNEIKAIYQQFKELGWLDE